MTLLKTQVGLIAVTKESVFASTPIKAWIAAVITKLTKKEAVYFMGSMLNDKKITLQCQSAVLLSHLINHNKCAIQYKDQVVKCLLHVLCHHTDDDLTFLSLKTVYHHLSRGVTTHHSDAMVTTPTSDSDNRLNDKSNHDVVFMVDNAPIYAHKSVLRKSKYFDTMFNFHEKNSLKKSLRNSSDDVPSLNACVKSITTTVNNAGFNTTFKNFNINGIMSFSNNFISLTHQQQQQQLRDDGSRDDIQHVMKKHRDENHCDEQNECIRVVDISVEVFLRLLTNLYTDDVTPFNNWEDAVATLVAADRYSLHQFIGPCTAYLKQHISSATFAQLFDINIGPDFSSLLQKECICWLLKTCEKMRHVTEIKDFVDMELFVNKIRDLLLESL